MDYKSKYKSLVISILLACLGVFIYTNKTSRSFIAQIGTSTERKILASVETERLNGPFPFKIFKIKEGKSLWLEIYFVHSKDGQENPEQAELHKKLPLQGEFDGHIVIQEQASNLALANIDNDKELEIIAPTYDRSMTPILNIYKYDPILEEFSAVNSSQLVPSFSTF